MSKGIAILGAGIFARDEHLPAIEACPLLSLRAIYSRSKKSADKLAKLTEEHVDTYFDAPSATGRCLDDLLAREDIHAVVIALPIPLQPAMITKAITAGKHVLSEKPIAPTVQSAVDLLKWYKAKKRREMWSVAENFRFMDQFNFGADRIRELKGEVVTFSVRLYGFIDDEDEFYQTEWRRDAKYPGGPLLDCGIHYVAGVRYLLAAAGQSITHIAAFTSQLQQRLAPLDTVHSTMRISNENNGTFSLSFGAEFKNGFEFQVVTDKGAVTVTPKMVTVVRHDSDGKKDSKPHHFGPDYGHAVENEVASFAKAINTGKMEQRASPEEALVDLKLLQAMLESGEDGGMVKSVR